MSHLNNHDVTEIRGVTPLRGMKTGWMLPCRDYFERLSERCFEGVDNAMCGGVAEADCVVCRCWMFQSHSMSESIFRVALLLILWSFCNTSDTLKFWRSSSTLCYFWDFRARKVLIADRLRPCRHYCESAAWNAGPSGARGTRAVALKLFTKTVCNVENQVQRLHY